MPTTDLRLRPLRLEDESVVRAAHEELAEDFEFAIGLTPQTDWPAYLESLTRMHAGIDLPADRVPATFLVAVVGGLIVGRTSVRHELNDWLLSYGGHIGYVVRPGYRRRGYAREMLRQSLVVARAHGVGPALLTCDDDNVASMAVIEGGGGRLDPAWPQAAEPQGEEPQAEATPLRRLRYWID